MPNINLSNTKIISYPFLENFKNEVIYGGYIPALVGPALVITTSILTKTDLTLSILLISYLIPLMVYSYDYYKDMDKDQDTNAERSEHFNKKSNIYPYILLSYLLFLIILLIFSNWTMIWFILMLILVGILYTLGLKKFTQKIPAFKNLYTILIWSLAGTFSIPFFNSLQINLTYLLIFLFFYLKMLPNTIFFDLKDIKSDRKEGLKTIPVILGKEKTLKFLKLLNIIAFIPVFVGIYLKIFPVFTVIMLIFLFYSYYYLDKTGEIPDKEMKMDSCILADVEFILWPFILILGNFFFQCF